MNLPLTVRESELLAECNYKRYYNPREHMHVDADGTVHVRKSVDAQPVMEAMKDYGDIIDRNATGVAGARMIGSVDPITANKWAVEWGCKVGTKEFAKLASKRLKDDSNYRKFKVGH